jgi:solute carrier family 5 (sodium-coupled monocarboxylate transporter), member 8/12
LVWSEKRYKKILEKCSLSFISGISLLGIPTEVYIYGIGYFYIMGGIILMGFVMMEVYLPVFHDLKLTSTYQVRKHFVKRG